MRQIVISCQRDKLELGKDAKGKLSPLCSVKSVILSNAGQCLTRSQVTAEMFNTYGFVQKFNKRLANHHFDCFCTVSSESPNIYCVKVEPLMCPVFYLKATRWQQLWLHKDLGAVDIYTNKPHIVTHRA